jgi:hypothetical protein
MAYGAVEFLGRVRIRCPHTSRPDLDRGAYGEVGECGLRSGGRPQCQQGRPSIEGRAAASCPEGMESSLLVSCAACSAKSAAQCEATFAHCEAMTV